jgi:polyisoprenoid-binding protein YceI
VASIALPSLGKAQVPVFVVTPEDSSIKFFVKASVAIGGTFDKWDTTLTFTSPDVTTAVLDVKIQADSVNTGSGMHEGRQTEGLGLLRREAESVDYVSVKAGCTDRS